jgi:hypothetical protein
MFNILTYKGNVARHLWLTPVILAETEVGRIMVQGQHGQNNQRKMGKSYGSGGESTCFASVKA